MLCFIFLTVLPKSALCDFVRPALFYFWNWSKLDELEGSENRSSISSFISKVSTQYVVYVETCITMRIPRDDVLPLVGYENIYWLMLIEI